MGCPALSGLHLIRSRRRTSWLGLSQHWLNPDTNGCAIVCVLVRVRVHVRECVCVFTSKVSCHWCSICNFSAAEARDWSQKNRREHQTLSHIEQIHSSQHTPHTYNVSEVFISVKSVIYCKNLSKHLSRESIHIIIYNIFIHIYLYVTVLRILCTSRRNKAWLHLVGKRKNHELKPML